MKPPVKTTRLLVGYNLLICVAAACAVVVTTIAIAPAAGLLTLGAVMCAAPLGRVIWP